MEKTETFHMRKYFENTGTNRYAAPTRGVQYVSLNSKEAPIRSSPDSCNHSGMVKASLRLILVLIANELQMNLFHKTNGFILRIHHRSI